MSKKETIQVNVDVIGKLDNFSNNLNAIQKQLSKLSLGKGLKDSFNSLFSDLEYEIKNISTLTSKGKINPIEEKQIQKSINYIENAYSSLIKKLESQGVKTSFLKSDQKAMEGLLKAQNSYKREVKDTVKQQQKLIHAVQQAQTAMEVGGKERQKKKVSGEKYQAAEQRLGVVEQAKKEAEKIKRQAEADVRARLEKDSAKYSSTDSKGFHQTKEWQALTEATNKANQAIKEYEKAQKELSSITTTEKIEKEVQELEQGYKDAKKALDVFNKSQGDPTQTKALEKIKKNLLELKGVDWKKIGIDISSIKNMEELDRALEKLSNEAGARAVEAFDHLDQNVDEMGDSLKKTQLEVKDASNALDEMTSREKEIGQLKTQILDFFSIGNAVELFKRSIRSAFDTVKELDATMTEAAVVTDFSVGDMWDKLPQYSSEANKLGASINDLYGATTLYYQQGLESNAAMGVGIETMKMARIANMDAAQATQAMTAALRGFNMEVNETNAKLVNDIYSELAAITAADTEQIATAMSKTASIASAANMEFGTTSALLAQIIETTQEAPETAGTALKTIIARFTEVKKLVSQGQLVGEDTEGEVIEINKIDTALKQVGISLKDFLNGTKGIDDIFLELAEKWDTLDLATQRYIATTAAGSRQQSRFLAMMSDYERTMELVNAANDSAGASQEQFEKTLDSLQSKLAKLKNAWDTFAMGLANNELLKGAIDGLTDLLTIINSLIEKISGGNGIVKSILSLTVAAGGLKAGKVIFDKLLGDMGKIVKGEETESLGKTLMKNIIKGVKSSEDKLPKELQSLFTKGMSKLKLPPIPLPPAPQLIAIAAAIGAVIAALIVLHKIGEKTSIEGRLKAAEKATKDAEEAAKSAKAAYDDLLGDRKEYQEIQNNLEGLTEGTLEWKEALVKANQQVLSLISTYPKLAQFMEKGKDGQLTISEEGWDEVVESQRRGVVNSQAAVSSSQIKQLNLQKEKAQKELYKNFTTEVYSPAADKLYEAYKDNAQLFAKDEVGDYSKGLKAIAEETGYTVDYLWKMKDALAEYDIAVANANTQTETLASTMLSSYVSEDTSKYKYGKDILSGFSKGDLTGEQKTKAKDIYSANGVAEAGKNEVFDRLAKDYEVTTKMVGDDLKDLKTLYTAMTGIAEKDIPEDISKSKKRLAEEIAKIDSVESVAKEVENFRKKMQELSEDEQKGLAALLSGQGKDFSYNDIDRLGSIDDYAAKMGYKDTAGMAEALGYSSKLGGPSIEAQLRLDVDQAKRELKEAHDYAINIFKDRELSTTLLDGLSTEVEKGLATQVKAIHNDDEQVARQQADTYVKAWNSIVTSDNLNGAEQSDLKNYLSQVDWTNMIEASKALEHLQSLGIDDTGIEAFWKAATAGTDAYIKNIDEALTLTKGFHEKVAGADIIGKALKEGTATEEQVQKLLNSGIDLEDKLQRSAEGWKIVSADADKVVNALQNSAMGQIDKVIDEYNKTMAKMHKDLTNNSTLGSLVTENKSTGEYEGKDISGMAEKDRDNLESALVDVGVLTEQEKGESAEEYWQRALAAYTNYVNVLNQQGAINEILRQEKMYAEAVTMGGNQNYTKQQPQLKSESKEERQSAQQSIEMSARNEGVQAGAKEEELIAFQQQLENQMHATTEEQKALAAVIATNNAKMNLGIQELVGSYSEWSKIVDEGSGKIKKGTYDDAAAFNKLKEATNKMLNTSTDLSDAFWDNSENLKNLKKVAEGDVTVLGDLQKAAAKDYLVNLAMNESFDEDARDAIFTLSDFIEKTELPTLEAGAELDDTDFIKRCNDLIKASGMTSEQVSEAFKNMGYDVEFDPNAQPVTQEQVVPVTHYKIDRNWLGQVTDIIPQVETQTYTMTSSVPAPTIKTLTSNGTKGGGVSSKSSNAAKSNAPKPKKGGGKKGGGSEKKEKPKIWENPYDEFYNLSEKINESLRRREKLERAYDRLLKDRKATSKDIYKNSLDQIASLKREIDYQYQLQNARLSQINKLGSQMHQDKDGNEKSFSSWGVTKYASYNANTGQISIDWDAIDKIKDEELGGAIDAYIKKLEELSSQYEETQDTIEDMEDTIEEIRDQGKKEYLEFEDRVYQAIVDREQRKIDDYQTLADTIAKSNSEVLNSLQESIDLERQIRDNTRTEEDIAEKESRLAYLQRDTSGTYDLEILKLQEELDKDRESYGDSLVDQEIDRLSKENQKAEEQRARQIEIMQAQLDYAAENGEFWGETYSLIAAAFNPNGSFNNNSPLVKLLQESEAFKGMSELGQFNWIGELVAEFNKAMEGRANLELARARDNGKLVLGNGTQLYYNKSKDEWTDKAGYRYNDVRYDAQKGEFTYGSWDYPASKPSSSKPSSSSSSSGSIKVGGKINAKGAKIYDYAGDKTGERQLYGKDPIYTVLDEKSGYLKVRHHKLSKGVTGWFKKGDVKAYKKGGLADFTGPAWLDGTKSHPEMVLNAKDTQNFIALKDILSTLVQGNNTPTQSSGDNYYEVHINVDEISNDYDVDRLAERIKQQINDDATYRNVNAINFLR